MSTILFLVMALVETAFIGGLFLLYPRFARRGLLFGVYVGEDVSSGPQAHAMPGSRLKAQGPTRGAPRPVRRCPEPVRSG